MSADEEGRKPPRRLQEQVASQAIADLFLAAQDVHQQLVTRGGVPEQARRQLHEAVSSAVFVLYPARKEDAIDWEEAGPVDGEGPDALLQDLFHGQEREVLPPGEHNPEPQRRRVPTKIDAAVLYETAQDLLDIAHKLGLTYSTDPNRDPIHADPV